MELSTDLTPAPQPAESTQLDTGAPTPPEQAAHKEGAENKEDKKPESRMDAIKRAAADIGVKEDDEDGKPASEAKESAAKEPAEKPKDEGDAKPAETKPEAQREARDTKDYPEAPSKFLPAAKEKWRNTPIQVQQEVARMARDHEAEVTQYKESHERWEGVRQFDELARQNGRQGVQESLAKVVEIERAIQQNPIAGLNKILMEIGPRKADGQPVSLYEVAMHIVQNGPDGYQQMMRQANQPAPQHQGDPRVEHLQQQLQSMQHEQLAAKIIDPFKAQHPRFDELQEHIAYFLESPMIPKSLSAPDRLAAAYDMAERINPPSRVAATSFEERPEPQSESRADTNLSGTKSVKGAPASGVDVSSRRKSKMSRSEAINAAMSELGL